MNSNLTFLFCNAHLFEGSNPAFFSASLAYEDGPRSVAILQRSNGHFDVLGFTEVWADSMSQQFSKALVNYNSYVSQADVGIIKRNLAGSPGMVLSVAGDWVYQPKFDYYRDMVEADSLAYKGVAFGVARINGKLVGLVQTHTQASYAGDEVKYRKARDQQIEQTLLPAIRMVRSWFDSQNFKGPIVLLGDLNIIGETDEYNWLAEELGTLGFQDCWTQTNAGDPGYTYIPSDNPLVKRWDVTQKEPQRLDYIFLAPGDSGAQCQEMKVLTYWKLIGGGASIDLSDHYPVSAIIKFP